MNHLKETLERMVCSVYQVKLEIDVNEARCKLLTKKKKPLLRQSLPPTKDVFCLHIKCANHHYPNLPNPVEHRWTDIDRSLAVQQRLLKPAPDSILEFVSCSCKKSEYGANHCGCVAVNLTCTDFCGCTYCKKNDSPERVDVKETFSDDVELGESQEKTPMEKQMTPVIVVKTNCLTMMKLAMISRKLYLQQEFTVQQKWIYLIGLPQSWVHSTGDIV